MLTKLGVNIATDNEAVDGSLSWLRLKKESQSKVAGL